MAIGPGLITGQVGTTPSYAAVDVAGHIPIKKIACTSDSRTRGFGDNVKTMLVDLLEEERGIVSSEIPTASGNGIGIAIEARRGGVFEVGEVITIAVNDN